MGLEEKVTLSSMRRSKIAPPSRRCLGPVANLEEQVQGDWWAQIFDRFYLKTDGDIVDDAEITKAEVDLLLEILKLMPEDRILDLCCGHGRHSLELARRGYKNVEGLDKSHYLIQKAKTRAKKENLPVKFREGNALRLPYTADSFNVVLIMGNSFGYFESSAQDLEVLKEVFRVLKPWGKVLIDVADGAYLKEHFQPRSWEWIDSKHFVCRERSLSMDGTRLICREIITHTEKGVIADRFYAERLYDRESLTSILKAAGFSDITFHGQLSFTSKRNQDLGLMEKRLWVTAVARKAWSQPKRRTKPQTKQVVVLLGDRTKPDPLKPMGIFDDDDIYTIDKLKEALAQLEEFRFSYLENHDTLLADLLKLKPKIDLAFNLCDEGYFNDPQKEAHVPALLEVLGIPYTGSGPRCLMYCYDKSLVRGVAREMGIPVPRAILVKAEDTAFTLADEFPVIVKPVFGDSSFGITQRSVVWNSEELIDAIREIRERFGYHNPILIEEFLTGKDLTVGIIGNPPDDFLILPITEEDYSELPPDLPPICGYEAKWLPDSPYGKVKSIPADIPEDTREFIVNCSLLLFKRLECRDYCRFDWRLDAEGTPRLLEVNPNPGWCWDGHLAKMAALAGITYPEMLRLILEKALRRLGMAH